MRRFQGWVTLTLALIQASIVSAHRHLRHTIRLSLFARLFDLRRLGTAWHGLTHIRLQFEYSDSESVGSFPDLDPYNSQAGKLRQPWHIQG